MSDDTKRRLPFKYWKTKEVKKVVSERLILG